MEKDNRSLDDILQEVSDFTQMGSYSEDAKYDSIFDSQEENQRRVDIGNQNRDQFQQNDRAFDEIFGDSQMGSQEPMGNPNTSGNSLNMGNPLRMGNQSNIGNSSNMGNQGQMDNRFYGSGNTVEEMARVDEYLDNLDKDYSKIMAINDSAKKDLDRELNKLKVASEKIEKYKNQIAILKDSISMDSPKNEELIKRALSTIKTIENKLSEDIEKLKESDISEISEMADKIKTEVDSSKFALERTKQNISGIVSASKNRIVRTEGILDTMSTKASDLQENLDSIKGDITKSKNIVSTISEGISKEELEVNKKIEEAERSISFISETLESSIGKVEAKRLHYEGILNSQLKNVENSRRAIKDIKKKVEEQLTPYISDYDNVIKSIQDLEEKIKQEGANMKDSERKVEISRAQMMANAERIEEIKNNLKKSLEEAERLMYLYSKEVSSSRKLFKEQYGKNIEGLRDSVQQNQPPVASENSVPGNVNNMGNTQANAYGMPQQGVQQPNMQQGMQQVQPNMQQVQPNMQQAQQGMQQAQPNMQQPQQPSMPKANVMGNDKDMDDIFDTIEEETATTILEEEEIPKPKKVDNEVKSKKESKKGTKEKSKSKKESKKEEKKAKKEKSKGEPSMISRWVKSFLVLLAIAAVVLAILFFLVFGGRTNMTFYILAGAVILVAFYLAKPDDDDDYDDDDDDD